jgi:hypothetical protein
MLDEFLFQSWLRWEFLNNEYIIFEISREEQRDICLLLLQKLDIDIVHKITNIAKKYDIDIGEYYIYKKGEVIGTYKKYKKSEEYIKTLKALEEFFREETIKGLKGDII